MLRYRCLYHPRYPDRFCEMLGYQFSAHAGQRTYPSKTYTKFEQDVNRRTNITHSISKRSRIRCTSQKQIPNKRRKFRCLSIRSETSTSSRSSHTEGNNLASGLTGLNLSGHELTIGQLSSGEYWVVGVAADLVEGCTISIEGENGDELSIHTLAKLISGKPPVPKKTSRNANGKTSTVSS